MSVLAGKGIWINRWEVNSLTSDKTYIVAQKPDGSWGCDCPAWKFKKAPRPDCKHILRVKSVERPDDSYTPTIDRNIPRSSIEIPTITIGKQQQQPQQKPEPAPVFYTQTRREIRIRGLMETITILPGSGPDTEFIVRNFVPGAYKPKNQCKVTRHEDNTWECTCSGTPPSWIWRPGTNTNRVCSHMIGAYTYWIQNLANSKRMKNEIAKHVEATKPIDDFPLKTKRKITLEDP